eukprot:TRINITY_DN23918_c0_g1_i2.p1 TRINITY_DN23918_c0_g1~~TRINITY_DN23918_c0_g1_i2.p1  ORF type:complete len:219 (+),score=53.63 TRINITY_DN23918_c0_g1_i2:247-903(+)
MAHDDFSRLQREAAAVFKQTHAVFDELGSMVDRRRGAIPFRGVRGWERAEERWVARQREEALPECGPSPLPLSCGPAEMINDKVPSGAVSNAESDLLHRRIQLVEQMSADEISGEQFAAAIREAEEQFEAQLLQQEQQELSIRSGGGSESSSTGWFEQTDLNTAFVAKMTAVRGWADALQEYTELENGIVKRLQGRGCFAYSVLVLLHSGLFQERECQ